MIKYLSIFIATVFYYGNVFSITTLVNNQNSLNSAISMVSAGDTIMIANDNEPYVDLDITIKATGTAQNPIVIQAETTGCVFITGTSNVNIGGEYIVVKGLSFVDDVAPTSDYDYKSIIEFRKSTNESDWCHNCRLTGITINNYNREVGTYLTDSSFHWIRVFGQNNEIDHCNFLNKHDIGTCITIDRSNNNGYSVIEERTHIHHNYFANRTQVLSGTGVINGQEAIRIGNSKTSLTDAYCEVYNNLFYNWIGEVEIISSKSGRNKYYNNTFRACYGSLTLRHGENCEVYGNFFFGRDDIAKNGGIRIMDSDHKIYNNYFQDLYAGSSKELAAIYLSRGDTAFVEDASLSGYAISEDILIAHNTIVNCDRGIWINPPNREFASGNLEIVNNVMINTSKAAIVDVLTSGNNEPATFLFGNNIFNGNIKEQSLGNSIWSSEFDTPLNLETTTVLTTSDGIYNKLVANSLAIDFAQPINTNFEITMDITGGLRTDNNPDAGAEEYNILGTNRPYFIEDVGVSIGVRSNKFHAKVLLEGAYTENGIMVSNLANTNLLPLEQPYNQMPWQYEGEEKIIQLPNTNIIDWILIEALDMNFNSLEKRAALVTANGNIIDTNGFSGVTFCSLSEEENYYFMIRHRNHLDIISSTPISIADNVTHDFANPANIWNGQEQLTVLDNGYYGLTSGDFDGNGVISVADFNQYISQLSTVNNYISSDANLDGNVTISDFNLYETNSSRIGLDIVRY